MNKKGYKWIVLLCITSLYFASNGYGYLSIPFFYPELTKYFNVPNGVVPQAAGIMTLIIAFLSPVVGYILDKFNPKYILIAGAVLLTLMQFYFTKIENLDDLKFFYAGYAIALSLGGFITSTYILNNWFDKFRGIALGIFLNASSLGAAIFNPYIGNNLKTQTWQMVSTNIFWITAFMMLIPVLFVKSKPKNHTKISIEDEGLSLLNAVKSSSFWLLLIVTAGLWFCINGILFHKDTFLTDLHLDSTERGEFGFAFFISGIAGKLIFGFLSDEFDKRQIMLLSILNLLLGSILLKYSIHNPDFLPMIAVIFGIGYSGAFTMIQLMIADYFMGKSYGLILGIFLMADTLAGTAGIILLGSSRKTYGSYDAAFLLMTSICILAFLAMYISKKPQPKKPYEQP